MTATAVAPNNGLQRLTLDQIAANFGALDSLMAESGGEITPEIEAWFAEYDLAEQKKVDGYVFYIKALVGQQEALKSLEQELEGKRHTLENRVKYLKQRVADYLTLMQKDEARGELYRFKLQKNGGQVPIEVLVEPTELPKPLTRVAITADMDAIRAGLLSGTVQPTVARFGEVGKHLRIY